jgi:hypothetical protein
MTRKQILEDEAEEATARQSAECAADEKIKQREAFDKLLAQQVATPVGHRYGTRTNITAAVARKARPVGRCLGCRAPGGAICGGCGADLTAG